MTGPSGSPSSAGSGHLLIEPRQVVEGAVVDHADPLGVQTDLGAQPLGPVLGMGDHSVHPAEGAPSRRHLAPARRRRQHVVGGHHPRPRRRDQQRVEPGDRQPLVVKDVGIGTGAAEGEHVGQVLGHLVGAAAGRLEAAGGAPPVEALLDAVAVGLGHGSVEEAAGEEADVGAAPCQGRGEGAVVGRREGRWVDQLHSHVPSLPLMCRRLS